MFVGILRIELFLTNGLSLKDKRMRLRSLIERIKSNFNVSASEVDEHDKWQKAVLGIAFVGNDKAFVNQVLCKIVDFVRSDKNLDIIDYSIEIL
ncbi:MAG: DUF503 domain-containing protein [Candidatus Omnitrophica bacterium]|nr:DUF503 domain-containing protein [Candidatus Omnitrophota bacterium]